MAIRFRCVHCRQLMSIASRQAGAAVPCPSCGGEVVVPSEDQLAETGETPEGPQGDSQVPPYAPGAAVGTPPPEPAQEQPGGVAARDAEPVEIVEEEDEQADRPGDGEFRLRRRRRDVDEMDLTPMVDVTFLLLIFFMVTASFSLQKSIEIPPPDPEQEGATQSIQSPEDLQANAIIVQIDERDAISIDYEPIDEAGRLAELLAERRRTEQKNELVIDADERARHGTVVRVNDAAIEADFQRIRLAVRAGGGE